MKRLDLNSPEVRQALREVLADTNRVHVIPIRGRWSVNREGAQRASRVFKDRQRAIAWARADARKNASELIVHDHAGDVQEIDTSYRSLPEKRRRAG